MSCPFYKNMKNAGTSFYVFPSAAKSISLNFDNIKFKYVALLNFPEQKKSDYLNGTVMNFEKTTSPDSTLGENLYNFDPNSTTSFKDQLIESLRNYVANYDANVREAKLNANTDFYNINETKTPTEAIFFKWARKLNLMDFEPAEHKIDWDKNLPDFKNENKPNSEPTDYFQKYLWKERETNFYVPTSITESGSPYANHPEIIIDELVKFKVGDWVYVSGDTSIHLSDTTSYKILDISFAGTQTTIILDTYYIGTSTADYVYLQYNRFVEYIGEIQSSSVIQTGRQSVIEITAQIPHHVGETPQILYDIDDNLNYYPNLELPILPAAIQEEILGAENLDSPIRQDPNSYPGNWYGFFDTSDKTYLTGTGDKLRLSGDYYGINLANNTGLEDEEYFEKLTEFNSDDIDGLGIDYESSHYLQMNLPTNQLSNFEEFNSISPVNTNPNDFEFNAILWYYESADSNGNTSTNLYGVEFLNNPENDFDSCDINHRIITPYQKLVSNDTHDGLSYIFSINVVNDVDNDVQPLTYDPATIYNMFGFDLYTNILRNNAKLYESFENIIQSFGYYNEELFNLKSLLYSQTDVETVKAQIENLNQLLQLYSTMQMVDTDTAKIEIDSTGVYPKMKMHFVNSEYSEILELNYTDVYEYNSTNSGVSYLVTLPFTNKMFLNYKNDNTLGSSGQTIINLSKDLNYKQAIDIVIEPNMADNFAELDLNINFFNGTSITETPIISNITLPKDLYFYDTNNPTGSTFDASYYNNIETTITYVVTGSSTVLWLDLYETPLFNADDSIYINNLFFEDSNNVVYDYSGVYVISGITTGPTNYGYEIYLDSSNKANISYPKIRYYKGVKYSILRVNESDYSSITDRYNCN